MIERINKISIFEWSLMTAIFFIAFWIGNPYIAKMLSLVLSAIILAILVISLIADKLDPSKISSKYYFTLLAMALIPIALYLIFGSLLQL